MATRFVRAYDRLTGRKLRHKVPEHFLAAGSPFPHLAALPSDRDRHQAITEPAEASTQTPPAEPADGTEEAAKSAENKEN